MSSVVDVVAREIRSRGNPTVECDNPLESGVMGRASGALRRPPVRARPSNCATATTPALPRQGRCRPSRTGEHRDLEAIIGLTPQEQAFIDKTLIDPTAPRTSRARRQRHARRPMAVAKAAAEESGLPLYRYCRRLGPDVDAGADDEHHQRRRARQQQPRYPGIHDPAGRRRRSG